eukprot:TRINITY_DN352_c0_g1_i1.p1 TRINITY_DN352_c0_g1~~TRINITY_DN352_c0_g1_i1.p1  ORF type:complete len:344 (-),score=45.99 TRINITY_DN352_c0_g1_i1:687-1718(-)
MGATLSSSGRRRSRNGQDVEIGSATGPSPSGHGSTLSTISTMANLGSFSHPQPPKVQPTCTIRSVLNLKKQSLKVFPDTSNPGKYLLSFAVDTIRPCSASVYLMAYEKESKTGGPPRIKSKHSKSAVAVALFTKGLEQLYTMAPNASLPLGGYEPEELAAPKGARYPLVIRLETIPLLAPPEQGCGATQTQTTYATLARQPDGTYEAQVVKQVLWVDNVSYVLHEIFGIERNADDKTSAEDNSKDCVICLEEIRDTLALPCRHLCMCSDCAKALRYQTNKCPICRCVVDSLLQIKLTSRCTKPQSNALDIDATAQSSSESASTKCHLPAGLITQPKALPIYNV